MSERKYKFTCPHCKQEASVEEVTTGLAEACRMFTVYVDNSTGQAFTGTVGVPCTRDYGSDVLLECSECHAELDCLDDLIEDGHLVIEKNCEEYTPTKDDISMITMEAAVSYFENHGNIIADMDEGALLAIDETSDGKPFLVRRTTVSGTEPVIPADEFPCCTFSSAYDSDDNPCISVERPDGSTIFLTAMCLSETPEPPSGNFFLEPGKRYSVGDIDTYLDALGDAVNYDSKEVINNGSLMPGDYLVYIDSPVKKWLYVYEEYINEWSSCYAVKYYENGSVPDELFEEARKFSEYIDNKAKSGE